METMLTDKSTFISLRDTDVAYVEAKAYYGKLLAGMDKEMLPLNDVEGKSESMMQLFLSSDVDVRMIKEFCAKHDFTEKAFFNACFADAEEKGKRKAPLMRGRRFPWGGTGSGLTRRSRKL